MNKSEFKTAVTTLKIAELKKLGFKEWDGKKTPSGKLLLIPGSLYNSIPENFTVYTIDGTTEKFRKDISDNDTRFGCLAYGIMVK
jgi:hypothetical protein